MNSLKLLTLRLMGLSVGSCRRWLPSDFFSSLYRPRSQVSVLTIEDQTHLRKVSVSNVSNCLVSPFRWPYGMQLPLIAHSLLADGCIRFHRYVQ